MTDKPDYPNSAGLFRNERTTPQQPVYKGDGNVECPHCNEPVYFKLAAWIREFKKDPSKKFMSLKLDPQSPQVLNQDFDDDMPF